MTQNLQFFTKFLLLVFCIYISSVKNTEPYYDKSNETDISQCNYGMCEDHNFGCTCNCYRVIGNGPSCDMNITFNNTHYYMTEICLLDDSILWEKNLRILKEHMNITRKDKNIITGIINGKTYIKVMYFCEKAYKKVYPVLRPTKETENMDKNLESLENKIEGVQKGISIQLFVYFLLGMLISLIYQYRRTILLKIRSILNRFYNILISLTTTTVNIDSTNINGVKDEKSILTDRNHDSKTPREMTTLTETVHNSDHNSSQEETEENMDSPLENRGSYLHPEHDSTLSENEDCEDPLLQNQKNSEIPTGNKNGDQ